MVVLVGAVVAAEGVEVTARAVWTEAWQVRSMGTVHSAMPFWQVVSLVSARDAVWRLEECGAAPLAKWKGL